MGVLSFLSKLLPEGNVKDILRIPIYWTLTLTKFVRREVSLGKGVYGYFYFSPFEKNTAQEDVSDYLKEYPLKKGDVVLDAGAFIGKFTVLAAKLVGKEGKVIAFEPDPFNRNILKKNIKANNLKNVVIVPRGLGNKEMKIGWSVGGIVSQAGDSKIFKIKITTLDKAVKELNLKKIDLLKTDIEGAEIEALKGGKNALKLTKHCAIASYHIVKGKKTCFEVEKILKKNGFKVKTEDVGQLITYASKK